MTNQWISRVHYHSLPYFQTNPDRITTELELWHLTLLKAPALQSPSDWPLPPEVMWFLANRKKSSPMTHHGFYIFELVVSYYNFWVWMVLPCFTMFYHIILYPCFMIFYGSTMGSSQSRPATQHRTRELKVTTSRRRFPVRWNRSCQAVCHLESYGTGGYRKNV